MQTKIKQITELQAIAQSGLAYCKDEFDIARYKRILEIAADLLVSGSSYSYEHILELFNSDNGYCTPKIDIRGAIFRKGKILLVQEKSCGLWSLPGGWADVNLSPSENVIKEIKEETGFDSTVIKLIGIFDKRKNNPEGLRWPHVYKVFFLCKIEALKRGEFDRTEILEMDFFDYENIPPLSVTRVNRQQIDLCFKHLKNKLLLPKFD